jgi:carboxypeptidase C (cathepsin A)
MDAMRKGLVSALILSTILLEHAFQCSCYTDDALKDEIGHLPGASSPLKSKQFSGFLSISDTKFIHYYYIESERSPETDSLVFWTNGGPGQ